MHLPDFVYEILILLGAAAFAAAVFGRLRFPAVLGFLLAGIVIGPQGLKLLTNLEHVQAMAEFGVVLLMLTIGLEFSLDRVRALRKIAIWGGSLQIAISILASLLFAWSFGYSLQNGLIMGFVIALSSTAIVLKHLMDRREMDTNYGRICLAILIFQDLAVPVMMLVILNLGGSFGQFSISLGWSFIKAALFFGGTLLAAKYVIFPFLKSSSLTRNRETFFLVVIALCLLVSAVSAELGLSMAIGAFLAGLILANTDFGYQLMGEIAPLRYLFVSLFFVSLGLFFDMSFAMEHWLKIALMVGLVLFVNIVIVVGVVVALGYSPRVAVASGLLLCQIGEFAFVLIQVARGRDVVTEEFYKLVMSAAFVTLFLSPFLFALIPKVLGLFERVRWLGIHPDEWNKHAVPSSKLHEHIIVCGYGIVGADLCAGLKKRDIPFIVLEMSSHLVQKARKDKVRVIAGDASNSEVLERANLEEARGVILSFSDSAGVVQSLGVIRRFNPDVYVAVRTRHQTDIAKLYEMGADLVVLEEWEASVQLNQKLLEFLSVPPESIVEHIEQIRMRQEILAEESILRRGRGSLDAKKSSE